MKKKAKRSVSLLLALALAVGLTPHAGSAVPRGL